MGTGRVIVVGGGAAGFFAAIACAQAHPGLAVTIYEKGPQFLGKVRISGGGRCNVTHACFDVREFSRRYPRGGQALIGPFHRFQARDTVAWFEARGVRLKTESDGRMFPITDSSETVIDCLTREARAAGVRMFTQRGVKGVVRRPEGGFSLALDNGETVDCECLLLASGGCRTTAAGDLGVSLGHTLVPPVPSLFTFEIATPWLRELAGVAVEPAEVTVPGARLSERGPVLVTHRGLSGPAILRLSAWGARALHERNYQFALQVNWLPQLALEAIRAEINLRRQQHAARRLGNSPIAPLPARLWERLVAQAGLPEPMRWAELPGAGQHALIQQLMRTDLPVTGKSLNKDEFVTCGGVSVSEVNFKTMESRQCPGLYFAGELLDIDGITGGFNFQAAWTTGWIAGQSMAQAVVAESRSSTE